MDQLLDKQGDKEAKRKIVEMSMKELIEKLPTNWRFYPIPDSGPGPVPGLAPGPVLGSRAHIKEVHENGAKKEKDRIRIDPEDSTSKYEHIHLYGKNGECLNIAGEVVDRNDKAGHIPYVGFMSKSLWE